MNNKDQIIIRNMIADAVQLSTTSIVPPVIEKVVNGKIKEVKELIETHIIQHTQDMDELRPFIQAKQGWKFFKGWFYTLGSLAAAWVAIKQLFPNL